MRTLPTVDIVIATIGRASLRQALGAALAQTYPACRTVVVADGPCPEARAVFDQVRAMADGANMLYVELPRRLGDFGDPAKRAWIDDPRAAEWIRFLDDDDWIPPEAIAVMADAIKADTALVLCGMLRTMCGATHRHAPEFEVRLPELKPHHACSGMAMVRTDLARASSFPMPPLCDWELAREVAQAGPVATVPIPLYWYRAHQGGKVRGNGLVGPYTGESWPFKPPRTFRKSLLERVPVVNLLLDDKPFHCTYDQALLRPMRRLAKRIAWITQPCYFYDKPADSIKTVARAVLSSEAERLIARGYLDGPETLAHVPPTSDRPEVVWLTPAYAAVGTIERMVRGIQAQEGPWRGLIMVDSNDEATYRAALVAVAGDKRYEVRLLTRRHYGLGAILAGARTLPANAVIALCDADDYIDRPTLTQELLAIYADPDVEIVCGTGAAMQLNRWAGLELKRNGLRAELGKNITMGRKRAIEASLARIEDEMEEETARMAAQRGGAPSGSSRY